MQVTRVAPDWPVPSLMHRRRVLGDRITYVGLDVHKDGTVVAVAEGGLRWMKTNSRTGGLAATRSISWPPSRSAPVSPWRTDKRACQEKTPAGEPGFQGIAIEQGDLRSIADT